MYDIYIYVLIGLNYRTKLHIYVVIGLICNYKARYLTKMQLVKDIIATLCFAFCGVMDIATLKHS